MKVTDDVKNVRRVHVEFSAGEVRRLIYDKVADTLGADVDSVVEHLRVDLSDGASATTYVRGELPVSRDQLLESLGLTPTEPVETDGAAVAESLGDHVTGTSDVVETPETLAAFEAVAGDPDQVLRDDTRPRTMQEALTRVTELVDMMRSMPARVETLVSLHHTARNSLDRDPSSHGGRTLLKIVEALESEAGLAYAPVTPQSEELPEVQVDRPESPATITVANVLNNLRVLNQLLGDAYDSDAPKYYLETAVSHLSAMFSTLQKYETHALVEGRDPQRLVPRPVSEDSLRQARLKLAELMNSPRRPEGRATGTDLYYVLSLLGGEL